MAPGEITPNESLSQSPLGNVCLFFDDITSIENGFRCEERKRKVEKKKVTSLLLFEVMTEQY